MKSRTLLWLDFSGPPKRYSNCSLLHVVLAFAVCVYFSRLLDTVPMCIILL